MDLKKRTCSECGDDKYLFRGRKKIPAEVGQVEVIETKFRCKACEHIWKEREPVKATEPAPRQPGNP